MKRYICKERFKDGRVRIKVVIKEGIKRIGIEHIGIAHNEEELKALIILAQEKTQDERQIEFKFNDGQKAATEKIRHKRSYSKYLYERLAEI